MSYTRLLWEYDLSMSAAVSCCDLCCCTASWHPLQVTKVSPTATNVRIVCCGSQALEADFTGVIRQQDVRTHEIDKVMGTGWGDAGSCC